VHHARAVADGGSHDLAKLSRRRDVLGALGSIAKATTASTRASWLDLSRRQPRPVASRPALATCSSRCFQPRWRQAALDDRRVQPLRGRPSAWHAIGAAGPRSARAPARGGPPRSGTRRPAARRGRCRRPRSRPPRPCTRRGRLSTPRGGSQAASRAPITFAWNWRKTRRGSEPLLEQHLRAEMAKNARSLREPRRCLDALHR
jgi:hypothetical protein